MQTRGGKNGAPRSTGRRALGALGAAERGAPGCCGRLEDGHSLGLQGRWGRLEWGCSADERSTMRAEVQTRDGGEAGGR